MTQLILEAISAVDWSTIEDAFGGADDTGNLLREYSKTRDGAIVADLTERSVHQGFRFATAPYLLEILCMFASESSSELAALGESIVTLALGDPYSEIPYLTCGLDQPFPPKRAIKTAIDEATAIACFCTGKKFAEYSLTKRNDASCAARTSAFFCSFWFYASDKEYQDSLVYDLQTIENFDEQLFRVVAMSLVPFARFENACYPKRVKPIASMLSLTQSECAPLERTFIGASIAKGYSFPWFEGGLEIPLILASLRDASGLAERLEISTNVFIDDPFRMMGVLWALTSVLDYITIDKTDLFRIRSVLSTLDLGSFEFEGCERLRQL